MSPVVLARKYRPRSFGQMVGQEHVVQALSNALTSGRLHHAYLFTGTRGIGKTTVSRILAKSLNCTGADGRGGVTAAPCGVCQACTEIDADRFIDYIELDAASNRSIEEIRELIERAAYKPSVGRYKVFMIDEAHQLTKDAFNALLKTLEEPPEYLKFVLATTDPEKMLPTVLSRCLQFNLRPMAPETVLSHLAQVLQAEGVPAEPGALRLLARAARGSMRDALSLTDQAIAYGAGQLREAGVRDMLGSVDRGHAQQLVQALARRDGPALLATVQALREAGLSAAGTLEELARLLQQMAVEQAVPGALGDDPEHEAARALAAELPADETQLVYSLAIHGRAELSLVSDEYAALTMVLLRLFAFPPAAAAAPVAAPRAAPLAVAPAVARASAQVARPQPEAPPPPRAQLAAPAPAPLRADPVARVAAPGSAPMSASMSAPASVPPAKPVPMKPPRAAAATPADAMPPWLDEELPPEAMPEGLAASDDEALLPEAPEPRREVAGTVPPRPATRAAPLRSASGAVPPRPVEPPVSEPSGPSAGPAAALRPTERGTEWADLLRPLLAAGRVSALVRELAVQAELIDVAALGPGAGRRWTVRVDREALRNPALGDRLAAVLGEALGEPVQLLVQPGTPVDSIARREAAAREAAQQRAEDSVRRDELVRGLLQRFPTARIVPGSVQPLADAAPTDPTHIPPR